MNATDTKFRSRSGAARKKPITARRRASLLIAAAAAAAVAIQISADDRFVIAVDAGSNQISVLRILPGGSLALVRGGVVSSAGVLPVSVAVHGNLVYVANAGTGGSNYTGFRLTPVGRLAPVPGSTVALPSGSQPGDVLFNNTAVNRGTVSAFTDSPNGTLSPVTGSPFADDQMAPCWVEISHDGQFLFTVNTASGTISRYSIAPGGTLTLLGSTTIGASGAVGAVDARLSPDGRFL